MPRNSHTAQRRRRRRGSARCRRPRVGINVVDLGLIYGVTVDAQAHAVVDMTLTSAACPLTDVIEEQTGQALEGLVTSFRINWVWMPPWGRTRLLPDGRDQLRALGFNV